MNENNAETTDARSATDLKSIGKVLKTKREELSYTLERVSEITRISLTSLRNIEEGELDKLYGLVFVRGFVRNYAKLLGLGSDWMIEALDQAYKPNKSQVPTNKNEFNEIAKTYNLFIFSGLIALILAIAGFLYWNSNYNNQLSSNIETIDPVQEAITENTNPGIANDVVVQTLTQLDEAVEQPEEKESVEAVISRVIYPLNLVLVGNSSEWIRLSVDKKNPIELLLTKGEKFEWPANEEYELIMTTGNSATIHLNGEEIEVNESQKNKLFRMKFNKFSLTQINN